MANKDIINPVDINNPSKTRRTSDLLPSYHRTDKNIKFLSSTLDQFIQQAQLERINGFVGSKLSLNYNPEKDTYIDAGSKLRNDYQLEPSLVIRDIDNLVYHASTYDDLINQLKFSGSKVDNLNRLFKPESVSYDPCIDWDKFVNFRQYYWLPMGPETVEISGQDRAISKTYVVSDTSDGYGLQFKPEGSELIEITPLLTLYRGTTYTFNVDSKYPFYIKTAYVRGKQSLYKNAIGQGTTQVTLVIDDFTPDVLFYFAEGNDYAIGTIDIKQANENTLLDIEEEVLGKAYYTSKSGVTFTNGMKVKFVGTITPEYYKDKEFFIEGVGKGIRLVDFDDLQVSGQPTTDINVNFDATPFDSYPFDDFQFVPLIPEYVTINRAALDLNSWSRYNRWVHADVIDASAKANGVPPVYPVEMRAQRPIVEFIPGLQLYNFGAKAKKNVDLIDTTTENAFAVFEKSFGFYIDQVEVEHGFRVIFNADTDPLVRGRIFEVNFVTIDGKQVVDLVEADDGEPSLNDAVVSVRGTTNKGTNWWYNGSQWVFGQQKQSLNQAPLFELYDDKGIRFSDSNYYNSSFKGTKVFGYSIGSGPVDPVLGFSLNYRNVTNVGDYLFENYFNTDSFANFINNELVTVSVAGNYLKVNTDTGESFRDIWVDKVDQNLPIIQFQSIEEYAPYIQIDAVTSPGYLNDLDIVVFLNDVKQIHNVDYIIQRSDDVAYITPTEPYLPGDRVLIKLYTSSTPINSGYYEVPAILTNNPLNGPIPSFTFTEVSDHVKSIVDNYNMFVGDFPGNGNLRDLPDISSYGNRILSHKNPISFAHYFLGTREHDIISAVRKVSFDYNQFKSNLIKKIGEIVNEDSPSEILDLALSSLNITKDSTVSYNYSDMIAYGKDHKDRVYTVTFPRNKQFSLETTFDSTVMSERAVLVYLNDVLLIKDLEYVIDKHEPRVTILVDLVKDDVIRIADYPSTVGNFVPPTPTKLGLYPKYQPKIYFDNTYASAPVKVIQGHDGSIMVAYNDFRDEIILEFEKRIYNNLKIEYNRDLFDINEVIPGAFRSTDYNHEEVTSFITPDFLKWVGYFGVDYQTNNTFDESNTFTFNYSSDVDILEKRTMPGNWRAIYKFFYDTDRPHTHPWEMLGFTEMPSWWENEYGPSPYTSGNKILWEDLEAGIIRSGEIAGTYAKYARPGLSSIIPVDDQGKLLSPSDSGLVLTPIYDPTDPTSVVNLRSVQVAANWKIGDHGPAETAWRRSSYWPFACQVMMALAKPASYAAKLFDPARMVPNVYGQYRYGPTEEFLTLTNVILHRDVVNGVRQLASGYSVFVIENGLTTDTNYLTDLKNNLSRINYNLMSKVGGFVSKDKLQVTIDAVDPSSPYPGVLIPAEDYQIFFNQSTPIESLGISGLIIQKTRTGFAVRGYDKFQPYFTIFRPFPSKSDTLDQVGGRSESYKVWAADQIYEKGDILFHIERYYRVKQKHNSGTSFVANYYQSLPYLPVVGGASALKRNTFEKEETLVPYGTEYRTIQEVYDLILGYGKWLTSKGFIFNDYLTDLDQVSDWNFSAREFLYWTTQNWAVNSVITLSPFAGQIEFYSDVGIVDSIVNNLYEYSLLSASGRPFPTSNFIITRLDGTFTLSTVNTTEGLFFARINVIQKEHAIIFNNFTLFNDVIYDIGSGYRQRRVALKGFRTSNWNGDFSSPGFVFDQVNVLDWEKYVDYKIGQVVRFSGKYYSAKESISGSESFDFTKWSVLSEKPASQLYANFDYKINQFEDFYSLDIDNFDVGQQAMAQHLIGYTPRPYLNNIIGDNTAQYKFYQGFIKEKGTKNPLIKLSKSSLNNWQSSIDYYEEWAFRIGYYGGYNTYQEIETHLESTKFYENPQIINFVNQIPKDVTDAIYYKDQSSLILSPEDRTVENLFPTYVTPPAMDEFQLPVAGYVRFDDIFATAYNKNSILDIANNRQLFEGAMIWLGFKENGDWDVLRYSKIPTVINDVQVTIPGQSLQIKTSSPHGLSVNDLISVNRIVDEIDQCYLVTEIVSPTEFRVYSTLGALPPMPEVITGLLFVFKSSRIDVIENVYKIPYVDQFNFGDLIWVDSDNDGNWSVYKKIDNYWTQVFSNGINNPSQRFGSNVIIDDNTFIVSSPNYFDSITDFLGRIFVVTRDTSTSTPYLQFSYSLNDGNNKYYTDEGANGFGTSLAYDSHSGIVIAGAPLASNVRTADANTIIDPGSSELSYSLQGIVKVSLLDIPGRDEVARVAITTPTPENTATFGASLAYSSITNRLIVGSPGFDSGIGAVYLYTVTSTTSTVDVEFIGTHTENLFANARYGSDISGNESLSKVAVSVPGYSPTIYGAKGAVFVYTATNNTLDLLQVITGDDDLLPTYFGSQEIFGSKVEMSKDGSVLVIGSPYSNDPYRSLQSGVVDVYSWNNVSQRYVWNHRIQSPTTSSNVNFGFDISISPNGSQLVISLTGDANPKSVTFDTYTVNLPNEEYINDPTSEKKRRLTTLDSDSTFFKDGVEGSGSVYVYNRIGSSPYYTFTQEIVNANISSSSTFGYSVAASDVSVIVGAPAMLEASRNGEIFVFDKKSPEVNGWQLYRKQEPLVDLSLIKNSKTINQTESQIQDYLDIIDPIKGNILETARQELKYITSYDPAIYSLGIEGVNTDPNKNWLDPHLGELWWDLSSIKYVWYEQGELEYRKNNWNGIFPGCTVDVYEWVESKYLPSEWSVLADTTEGLALGISGQPKFVDNSVMSVKQVYNAVANAFTNVYYYWVKNKTVTPNNIPNRRISAYDVSRQIADPVGTGSKFISFLSKSSFMLANSKTSLQSDQININIVTDSIVDSANRHTEWLLLQENDPNSRPNALLEKKLFDSLLGHDSLGNLVPDPTLPEKIQYGVEIRPRQGLFVNRSEALRNILEFTNNVLSEKLITGYIDFTNLLTKDQLPDTSMYDVLVEDLFALDVVPTTLLKLAKLTAISDSDGRISYVRIDDPGFGYLTAPQIVIGGAGSGATGIARINAEGMVIGIDVVEPGNGYITEESSVEVRPFTALVQTDVSINGKWAVYEWDYQFKEWKKTRTQEFDTTSYWSYVDWRSDNYDSLKEISVTVGETYELNELTMLEVGSYVKVQNSGDGRYIIVEKRDPFITGVGTFDSDWDLVYSENGTIKFSDQLWSPPIELYTWDSFAGFDQTSFDQGPDKELEYILLAIRDDIFTGPMKVYWNQLFFKAVRYAFSEQKTLDWAFKTTFISVNNSLGSLDQKNTYKLQNSKNYEDFLKEIKPYHTKIRKFTESYTATELTQSFTTDFDLPSYYNTSTSQFEAVRLGNNLLLEYPWKSWYDNYAYGIESINVYDNGEYYTEVPTVNIITAPGDTGFGASAVASISLGKVDRVTITNPGNGYTVPPMIVFNGGGNGIASTSSVTTKELKVAKAYAQLGNSPVRSVNVTMKFDRISTNREIGDQFYTDTFVGDGENVDFNLTWVPIDDKSLITLKVNGVLQLIDSYRIIYSNKSFTTSATTTYTKKYALLKLAFIPKNLDVITIEYPKDQSLYTALDRILDYYEPTSGMPGKDPDQLMSGMSYSGLQIDTLPFDATGGWDMLPYDKSSWDNYALEEGYISFVTTSTNTQTFVFSELVISTGTQVNVYLNKVRRDSTATGAAIPTIYGLGTGAVNRVILKNPGAGYVDGAVTATISAPNTLGGIQAYAAVTVVDGAITEIVVPSDKEGSGYTETPVITITGDCTVQAYATVEIKSEFSILGSTATFTEVVIPSSEFVSTSTLVEFRYASSDGTLQLSDLDSLDSIISGGTISSSSWELSGALGVLPSEIILDGGSTSTRHITGMNDDGFLNPIDSYAPEECVPGQVREAFAISVYTRPELITPVMVHRKYRIDGVPTTYQLGIKPTNINSVFALFNDVKLTQDEYVVDFTDNTFRFASNTARNGWLSLTSMQLGSVELLDSAVITTNSTGTVYETSALFSEVGSNGTSTYVTINGTPAILGVDYTVYENTSSNRAEFAINSSGTIQAFVFGGPVKSFSEVSEQIELAQQDQTSFTLTQPPGKIAPFHSQVIVTKNSKRLAPPVTTYYQVSGNQRVFDISQSIVFPIRSVGIQILEVYVNGVRSPIPGIWKLNQSTNQITFKSGSLKTGDVIAIVVKKDNDYIIENNQLLLERECDLNDEIKIITFTNHDPDFIRTERFKGNMTNQYRMQRPILDSAYVWVSYNGDPLTPDIDFVIDEDGYLVRINRGRVWMMDTSVDDDIVITSFAGSPTKVTSFRMFKDILGRTHYKRMSDLNSTVLTQPLYTTSTSISVMDTSYLTPPDASMNRPGVVLVAGERIEFFEMTSDTLSSLRRGTLGTAPREVYVAGTQVLDQGSLQTIPAKEFIVSTSTIITTSTQIAFDLSNLNLNSTVNYSDQIEVRYGGRLLLKPGLTTIVHDYNLSYDSTSTSETVFPPEFSVSNTSSVLTLNFQPSSGVRLEVISRRAAVFDGPTINFIQERSAALPDKYRYG